MLKPITALLARRAEVRAHRARDRESLELVGDFEDVWRRVCEHVGLSRTVTAAAGPTIVTPRLVQVDISAGHPALIVRLMAGQLAADVVEQADRIAPALGVPRVRITPRGFHWVRIELLQADPLDVAVETPASSFPRSVAEHPVLIARDEAGTPIWMQWGSAPHAVVQGRTRSGKSVWCYSILAQLAGLSDVVIAGSDPSGLLLGRPFEDTRHREWQAVGSRDVDDHLKLLRRLVGEMDRRISDLPARSDKLTTFSPDCPLLVVVLEEFAGLLRLASTLPTPRGEAKVRDQLLGLYGRLVSEGHKAGLRLLLITQRADATIVGGFERGQLGLRLSFAVDDAEALPMLHGADARRLVSEHRYAPPGVALLDTPTTSTCRVRGPRLPGPSEDTDYARYWDEITGASARLQPSAR